MNAGHFDTKCCVFVFLLTLAYQKYSPILQKEKQHFVTGRYVPVTPILHILLSIHSCIHLFNKYCFTIYYIPDQEERIHHILNNVSLFSHVEDTILIILHD